jgi:P4 family phage/plasmid primase-like protien
MSDSTPNKADIAEIKQAINVLFQPSDVVELRALKITGKTHAGYFNDLDLLKNQAARLSGLAAGVYAVLNQINPNLLARSQNRITVGPEHLTQDKDIIRRRWLPIDADARRPSGISSTEQEHEAAITVAKNIKNFLLKLGFPADSIIVGDSGNGGHVLIRIDLPNDEETEAVIKNCLRALAVKFDNETVSIDQSVFNASRIWKLPGTQARKGDSTDTRPHRIAHLIDVPTTICIASIESVEALAAAAPELKAPRQTAKAYRGDGHRFDLEAWLVKNDIEVKSSGPYEGGTRYILKVCPFNSEHTGTSVAVFRMADGALGFKCQHASCADKTWSDLRELKEPGYKDRRNGHREDKPQNAELATKRTVLEDAVLTLVGVCDGAIEKDGQGLNKLDADLFRSLAASIGRGEPIAGELRSKVKKRIVKYTTQLTERGININDMILSEERGEQNDGKGDGSKEALIPVLAEAILQDDHFAQDEGGKLYRYHEGVYRARGAAFIGIRVKSLLNSWGELDKWRSRLTEEVIEFIRVDSPLLWERPPLDTLNVLNGLLDVNTLELNPHSPDFLSLIQIPIVYDPTAICPAWDKFINDVFPEDALALGYEIPAYLMTPDTSIQKAAILLAGEGGTGKSTELEGVRAFIGKGNTSSLSLQKLESDRFASSRLVGKLANICPDLPSEHLAGTSTFKTITGGDTLSAEYKFRDSFDFTPYSRLVFSANHWPQSSDSSQAFFDRWLVVPFSNRFRGEKKEISRAVLDAQLADSKEQSGLLNKAIVALKQIRANHGFTESKLMKAAWDEFRATTDPLAIWLSEATIESPDIFAAKRDLITAYNREAGRKGQPRMSDTAFGTALRRLRPNLQDGQRTISGKLPWVWLGIGLKPNESRNGDDNSHGSRGSLGSLYINRAGENKSSGSESDESDMPVEQDTTNRVNRVNSVNEPDPIEESTVTNADTSH